MVFQTGRYAVHLWLLRCALLAAAGCNTIGHADEPQQLVIETRAGARYVFAVEIADSNRERARGLMYRHSMADDHGMLLAYKRPTPVNIWMKNTYLPLDVLFITAGGRIVRLVTGAVPLSTRLIPSGVAVLGVLEINAGLVEKLGIATGDRVVHPWFARPVDD